MKTYRGEFEALDILGEAEITINYGKEKQYYYQ